MHASAEERARIMAWRRSERQRLIALRLLMSVADRQRAGLQIASHVDAAWRGMGCLVPGAVVSGYWPLQGEPDLRPWLGNLHAQGLTCVLPVVVAKDAPLAFRRWSPGCAMEKGFWNIPVPVDRTPHVPQLLLAPVVGFDARCYRLGYGGGYFDRTLAQLASQRHAVQVLGVGLALSRVETIHPLPHDMPLHGVVTESGVGWLPGWNHRL